MATYDRWRIPVVLATTQHCTLHRLAHLFVITNTPDLSLRTASTFTFSLTDHQPLHVFSHRPAFSSWPAGDITGERDRRCDLSY